MNEAGFSITFKMYDAQNNDIQITMRGETPADWKDVLAQRKALVTETTSAGWRLHEQAPKLPSAPQVAPVSNPQPLPPPYGNGNPMPIAPAPVQPIQQQAAANGNGGVLSFHANRLRVAFSPSGQKCGKMLGGQFTQHGVTLWPETALQLGWDINAMQPGEYTVDMVVAYALNNQGKPSKVTGRAV